MKRRKLGHGPEVSAIGLGCMSFGGLFGATDEATSHRCLDAAHDAGIDFLDVANIYGRGRCEEVIGGWLAARPHRPHIATKAGITRGDPPVDNSEAYMRAELEASLKRLGTDHVTLFYAHRRDQRMEPEEIAGVMGRFIDEGLIGGYGLSEVSPVTLHRAHAERSCMAVQNEYSLWSRLPELGMIRACADLDVAFVPFSPLARGMLGQDWPLVEDAFRGGMPRFQPDALARNKTALAPFKAYAADRGVTVAALSLAWTLDRGAHLIPIPGTRTAEHLAEWADASEIALTDADRAEIDRLLPPGFAHGDRYSPSQWETAEGYC